MIPVIDVFAGPGGFHEGFSALLDTDGNPVFEPVASIEMEQSAHSTLTLRAAYWALSRAGEVPDIYYAFIRGEVTWESFSKSPLIAPALAEARDRVHMLELGADTRAESDTIIRESLEGRGENWALVGGPPCQAYSTVGRARRREDKEFEADKKHFLYKEYLHIIAEFRPAVFVMENVTGMLSSMHGGTRIFERILADLKKPNDTDEYEIRSFVAASEDTPLKPSDFVIRAEKFGIPQGRHRVILFGVRKDLQWPADLSMLVTQDQVTVRDAIAGLPKIRSSLNPMSADTWDGWVTLRDEASVHLATALGRPSAAKDPGPLDAGASFVRHDAVAIASPSAYDRWVTDERIGGTVHHESRRHMASDLVRYSFLADFAEECDRTPKLDDLPFLLAPAHKNIGTAATPFTDRFRVQRGDAPSSTIVAHIAKDGHYYIHPDAAQMRSLTVREVARLQTFPDNFFFWGKRTQQYVQIGNAVPPLLAYKIAELVALAFTARSSAGASVEEVLQDEPAVESVNANVRSLFPELIPV